MWIVYGYRGSGAAIVEAALAQAGQPYELRHIDLRAEAQQDEAYLQVNPHGKLPAVTTPEGETLTETLAIGLTLDDRFPTAGLLPHSDPAQRATALRWLAFAATELYPVVEILDYPERFTRDSDGVAAVREAAVGKWRERLLLMERTLGDRAWVVGDACTLVDIYWSVVSRWGQQTQWRADHTPRLDQLYQRVVGQPAIGAAWAHHHQRLVVD